MSQPTIKEVLLNPVFNNNPIGLQILGICSALAAVSYTHLDVYKRQALLNPSTFRSRRAT